MSKLAINGGTPVLEKNSLPWPIASETDKKALLEVYNAPSGSRKQNKAFCESFAAYSDAKYCHTVANGTVSIELILRALGIGRGDEVIVPPYTFVASVSAIIYVGATPVFADIDPETLNLDPACAEKAITEKTKAIMPVFVGGRPADVDAFEKLCQKRGLYLIIDAAQAVGSEFASKKLGKMGVAASISCQNTKNLSSGEGGIILTSDDGLNERLSAMLNSSPTLSPSCIRLASGMSEYQAAILNSQLPNLDAQIQKRMENSEYLTSLISGLDCVRALKQDDRITKNSRHLYIMRFFTKELYGVDRDRFLKAVRAEGAPITPGYNPLYTFPCMKGAYTNSCLEAPINCEPDTPVCHKIATEESGWIYHSHLLKSKREMELFAEAIRKVSENIDELR